MNDVFILIFDIIVTLFMGFVFIWFMYKILTPKKEGRFFRLSAIIMAVIFDLAIQLLHFIEESYFYNLINHTICFLFPFIYALLFCKGSVIKKLLVSIMDIMITLIIGTAFVAFWMLLGLSYDDMHNSTLIFVTTTIIVQLLTFAACILVAKAYKKINVQLKEIQQIQITFIFVLTLVFLFTTVQIVTTVNDATVGTFLLISTICMLSSYIIAFYLIYKISKNNEIEKENALLKMEKEYQKQKYEDIIQQSEQIRKLRHDYKNNFLVIRSLITDNNTAKAIQIINKDIDQINTARSHIQTNNEVVNAIINTKMSVALAKGIKVSFISISDFDGIDDFDLCNLISNMFDNAITAVQDCEDKFIDIKISKRDDYYTVKMSNSIPRSVLSTNPKLSTTKNDKAAHGLGMKIIKDITDRYSGELDYYEENETFYILAHLALKPLVNAAVTN